MMGPNSHPKYPKATLMLGEQPGASEGMRGLRGGQNGAGKQHPLSGFPPESVTDFPRELVLTCMLAV